MRTSLLASLLLSVACGASSPKSASTQPDDQPADELAERRRQRRVVKDLEHEIARLKAEVGTIRSRDGSEIRGRDGSEIRGRDGSEIRGREEPALPVDVRGPSEPARSSEPEPVVQRTEDGEPVVVAGYDSDGTEILYVGEAAQAPSVRPTIELSNTGPSKPAEPARRKRPATRKELPPVPASSDSLGVATVGPKISAGAHGRPAGSRPAARKSAASKAAAKKPARSKPARRKAARRRAFRANSATPDLAKSQYRAAYETLRAGEHEAAVALFRAFIAEHRGHDYADNAQYWLGEAFYDRRQFDQALAEFEKVIQNYPSGNKVAGAKLKVAYCHLSLGHTDETRSLLEALIEQHPRTRPARLAAKKLESL